MNFKLIKIEKCKYLTNFYYENNIIKRIFNDGVITWSKDNHLHKEDGASVQNYSVIFNKYKRNFYLGGMCFMPYRFAEKTNHKICLICNDFCNQECFI